MKHTCKLCSAKVNQLIRHLTITHELTLDEYLQEPHERILYEQIEDNLRIVRSANSPFSVNFYLKKGYSLDKAELAVKEVVFKAKNKQPHVSTLDYWLLKGFSLEEATSKLEAYRTSIKRMPNLNELIKKYGHDEGNKRFDEHKAKFAARPIVHLNRLSENSKDALIMRWLNLTGTDSRWGKLVRKYSFRENDLLRYRLAVDTATNLSLSLYLPNLRSLGSIDHKFSVYGGFVNKLHPLLIGCAQNLRAISRYENTRKGAFCIIEKAELTLYQTILNDDDISQDLKRQINEVFIEES